MPNAAHPLGLSTPDATRHPPDDREDVIQAWYMDDSDEDQRLPHHRNPEEYVSLDQLAELGVLSWRLEADNYETDDKLKEIREARRYSYMFYSLFFKQWLLFTSDQERFAQRSCQIKKPRLKTYLKNISTLIRRYTIVSHEVDILM
ncbi:homogentisate 1,2-dioxygenase [Sarracenia purpurea var. burkii]